jgi:hypothetical protein
LDFDATSLMVSFVISAVGFVAFMYGKKQNRLPQMAIGFALMAYPYFVSNVYLMGGIGVGLVGLLVLLVKMGL